MIPVDLITGFLGAGTTTFLLRYARWLLSKGLKIGILVYDHGAVNVDLPLLNPLRGERCELETLAASCDTDCHRRRFRTKLLSMAMCGYDRILIEPSGVFDMDEYFDTLADAPLDHMLSVGNVICIVDAKLPGDSLPEEDFFLASQAACAGSVVLSQAQLSSEEERERTLRHLERALAAIHAEAIPRSRVLIRDWDSLTGEDCEMLSRCGAFPPDYRKTLIGAGGFQSLSFLHLPLDEPALREKTNALFSDASFGHILRVKGFFETKAYCFQINATAHNVTVDRAERSLPVLTVIGRELNESAINLLLTGKAPMLHIL